VERWHRVSAAALVGDRALVEIGGRTVVLFRVDGTVHAFDNACPHEGNPLVEGEIVGPMLTCVYHGWRFDLETGACLLGEGAARRYPTEVRDGAVWVDLGDS
jgi:nitrite reductase/ring-hydroxylating ferredoxin subunit